MFKRDTYFDYIRAFAVAMVILNHKNKMPGGGIGVSIFFCLSGFLITRILINLPTLSAANIAKFIFRRWMRIFPLYLATIIAVYFLMRQFNPQWLDDFVRYVPRLLTMTGYPSGGISLAIFWTLYAEFWFYVCFPLVFVLTYRRRLLLPAIIALIAVSYLAKPHIYDVHDFPPWLTVVYLDQLLYGAICALLIAQHSPIVGYFQSGWWFWAPFSICLIIGKFGWFTSHDAWWHLQTSGAALLTALAILHHAAKPEIFKDNFISWLGRISFSIYLIYGMVIDYIPTGQILDKFDTPLTVVIVVAISYFTEKYIERPGVKLSKMVAKFRPAAEASSRPVSV